MDRTEKFTASPHTLDCIAEVVVQTRPAWDHTLVRAILQAHAGHVDGSDLAIAAVRCAQNLAFYWPKAIGWRGPHWDGLDTRPPEAVDPQRCGTCGKPEPRCYGERPGQGDDHEFDPVRPLVMR